MGQRRTRASNHTLHNRRHLRMMCATEEEVRRFVGLAPSEGVAESGGPVEGGGLRRASRLPAGDEEPDTGGG